MNFTKCSLSEEVFTHSRRAHDWTIGAKAEVPSNLFYQIPGNQLSIRITNKSVTKLIISSKEFFFVSTNFRTVRRTV